jgi:GT2 family glycosyltransferase
MSIWVGELDLSAPQELKLPVACTAGHALVWAGNTPLGWIWLEKPTPAAARFSWTEIEQAVTHQLSMPLARHTFGRTFMPPAERPVAPAPISVIVCTRGRPEKLRDCLEQLGRVDYPNYELIVVENVPVDSQVRDITSHFGARYVAEARPGLNWARNCGLQHAGHGLVAFIDDDARADRRWLSALNQAFSDDEVMAVTGLVMPLELETSAQTYFEFIYGGMGKGFVPRSWRREQISSSTLLWASRFGVGTNMGFRKTVFEAIGAFDVALDVGTATRGGGDVEMFHRLVARGHLLRYEPEAVVWHQHRKEFSELRRQLFNNGCSTWPYLFTCWRNATVPRVAILKFGLRQALGWWLLRRLLRPGRHSRRLVLWELAGYFRGLASYAAARRAAARLAGAAEVHLPRRLAGADLGAVGSVPAKLADE